ncbi:EfeM/EfeO family lipoprotein [Actinacidiphila cocklensis]|uniref:Iron uptake system component EfeO n=1 Tax=Actinacidiphila cocklensis TaxID=887465 RepID=A0A9W4GT64_9ACTN|nr:Iron uptake system component EfeO [Actinacidiphila cocklensis]
MSAEPDGIEPPHPPSSSRTHLVRRWQAAAAVVVVAAAVTATVLAAGSGGGSPRTDAKATAPADGLRHTAVEVSTGTCGRGWSRPQAGTQVFDLHNTSGTASEVDLTDPRTGRIFGEVEGLAPGTTRPMTVDLGSGSYAFKCLQDDTDAVTGPTVVVAGRQPQGPAAAPVNQHDLIPPTLAYQKWVGQRIGELAAGTGTLKADIDRGDLAAARRDWLPAHLVYERMGAAYDTFGDADAAINGTVARTPGAVDDPDFAGFHRIEYGLWHGESAASLRAPAAALDSAVRTLRDGWSEARMDPAAMGLRAHEIIENAEQFELTARTDYGSGTNLATARANVDGTRAILGQLRSLLVPRDAGLAKLDAALDRTQAALDAQQHGGTWTPVDRLTHAQRQQINADFGDLLEQLAPVAAIFEVRRTA